MPKRNAIKQFHEGGYYHVYNRGVNKSLIFSSNPDYEYYLRLLAYYLTTDSFMARAILPNKGWRNESDDLSREVKLISFCLMPNHYHLLIQQLTSTGLTSLMRRVNSAYTRYYNYKYQRTGHLCEGTYLAVQMQTNEQLIQTSRYIHRNPLTLIDNLDDYLYSNFKEHCSDQEVSWQDYQVITSQFCSMPEGYRKFVLEK